MQSPEPKRTATVPHQPSGAQPPPGGPAPGLSEIQWTQLRDQLERSVGRVCPAWLNDRRDDLVQVAMMRVMAVLKKSEWNRELGSSYLSRVAYSALVDEIRRLRRRREIPLTDEEGEEPQRASEVPDPERTSMDRQMGHSIRTCLASQVRSRRLAVTLNLQGYSVPDAARLLEWTVKKTENLVYRGLADLRLCLSKKGWRP